MPAVEDQGVADDLRQLGTRRSLDFGSDHLGVYLGVACQLDFDQLMALERDPERAQHAGG